MKKFKFLEHTADVKFQAFGKSLEEAFGNSAIALKQIMTKGIEKDVKGKISKKIKITGDDLEGLLYNFLEEFLYLLDAENFLLSEIDCIKIKNNKLEAELSGDKARNYKFTNDVKAVTYNEMFVKHAKGKWIVQVVLDV
ncbi:MAG: archease [Nanoarchaeota archaeon]|nr:archease [Nanoarchaeota archaeon]